MRFLRTNQSQLCVELYQGLMDHINNQAAERHLAPGKIVIEFNTHGKLKLKVAMQDKNIPYME